MYAHVRESHVELHGSGKLRTVAERFAALSQVGAALMSELNETRLLYLIAKTACELTNAAFAAFSLRPIDERGEPLVPSEGNLFHLAAVVGVTPEQEELFRRMPLGGEGLLAPIFRHGVPVLIDDALKSIPRTGNPRTRAARDTAREAASFYAHGEGTSQDLRSMGIPHGHPVVRSFLGAPLLDRNGQVRGGLLLGHAEPGEFTKEDETLLVGLAAQAAVALENARLFRASQMRVQEMDAIFESIADAVTLVDAYGAILRENDAARQLREEIRSHTGSEGAIEALLHVPARRALNGEIVRNMSVLLGEEQGAQREYVVTASPFQSPKSYVGAMNAREDMLPEQSSGAVVVWRDVTERRLREAEQRSRAEAEARLALLQMILNELPTSVYLVRGDDARLVLANRSTEKLWGAYWKQGQPMREFLKEQGISLLQVDGRPLPEEQFATLRAVRLGETVRHHEEIIRQPGGTALPVLVNAVALGVEHLSLLPVDGEKNAGEPAALVLHQDVTALKEAERLKDEFLSIVAHELRNPISVLGGFAQTLRVQTARGNGPDLSEWQLEAIQDIELAAHRLDKLTEDLLDVTRLQAGRLILYREHINLVTLVQRQLRQFQMATKKHTLVFSQIPADLQAVIVVADAQRLEQVVSNLLSNAIKYSADGGTIEVLLHSDPQAKTAQLSIHDSGIGIPAREQARIFGRFARAENARISGVGGTGLGLYLCRELVEWHGGRIWFESTEGEGSTFYISFPLFSDGDVSG